MPLLLTEKESDEIAQIIADAIQMATKPLEERIKQLEVRQPLSLADSHKGTWAPDVEFKRDDLITWNGSTWLCTARVSRAAEPGESDNWRLVAQRGQRGKDGRIAARREP